MKFWQLLAWVEPQQMLDVARFAEELGFEGVMMSDHGVFPRDIKTPYPYAEDGKPPTQADDYYPDCWVSIGAMAAATRRLKLSVGVYVLPLRNVFEIARATGTLGLLSNNRFILGAGIGWMKEEYEIYGTDFHTRGKRLDESIDALRLLWQGKMVEYHGELIDFPPLQISPAPALPIPIYLGGTSAPALRRTALKADGWIGFTNTPEEMIQLLRSLQRMRKDAGREYLSFRTVAILATPPAVAAFRRIEEAGVTDGVNAPFVYTCGGRYSTLDQKKRVMERFAEDIIRRCS